MSYYLLYTINEQSPFIDANAEFSSAESSRAVNRTKELQL